MSEREDMGAGIYMALSALVFLVCFLGAFFLPESLWTGRWLGIVALIGFFIGLPILLRMAHRSRIRDAVAQLGGTVLRIRRLPFWRQRFPRYFFFLGEQFQVDFVDFAGLTHRALCNSGFFQGVEWLEDRLTTQEQTP